MAALLYDLCGADEERRFSPYCWRIKMALKHKGIPFETEPVRFGTIEKVAFSGQSRVPVLVDGDRTIFESFDIACYLEDAYPDRPPLFGGPIGRAEARFINAWADTALGASIVPLFVLDILASLHPDDAAYFRESREKRFGMTLEAFAANAPTKSEALYRTLLPLRTVLASQPFLCGETAGYGDYAAFGHFASSRTVSPVRLLRDDDPVADWRRRMFGLFDGYAASAKGFPI